MASLFTSITPTGTNTPAGLANFLAPLNNDSGGVDVVENYTWTLTPQSGPQKGRSETPYVKLKEYRFLSAALETASRYYVSGLAQQGQTGPFNFTAQGRAAGSFLNLISQYLYGPNGNASTNNPNIPAGSPYAGLFNYEYPTGFEYKFPYFGEINSEVTNTWTALDSIFDKFQNAVGSLASQGSEAIETLKKALGTVYELNYPRVGIMDRPKLWESSGFRTINIRFPLFNTFNTNDIMKNWELCYLLVYQNMFNKRDFITAVPPGFYTVYIPGQYFTIAAYVSNIQIRNRGNMRLINIGGKERNVPDVYEVDMTLTDMIMPSQNMQTALLNESPIRVQDINKDASPANYRTGDSAQYTYNEFPKGGNPIQFTPFGQKNNWNQIINSRPRGGISFNPSTPRN